MPDTMMKAARIAEYRPPEVLRLVDVPRPASGRKEVLVRIHAASINPLAEWWFVLWALCGDLPEASGSNRWQIVAIWSC